MDGRFPKPPIALCEVQGYVYGAYLARAHFAWEHGDAETHRVKSRLFLWMDPEMIVVTF